MLKYVSMLIVALFFVLGIGCAKSEKDTSETASTPESLYKGQIHALENAKELENITEKSIKKQTQTIDEANQ